jgi:hypothetical protein
MVEKGERSSFPPILKMNEGKMSTNNAINSSVSGSGLPAFTYCTIPTNTPALLILTTASGYIESDVLGAYLTSLIDLSQTLDANATLVFSLKIIFDLAAIPAVNETVSVSIGTDQIGAAAFAPTPELISVPLAMVTPSVTSVDIPVLISDIADAANTKIRFTFLNNATSSLALLSVTSFVSVMYLPTGYSV